MGYKVARTETPAACTIVCRYRNLLGGGDQLKIDLDILNWQTLLPVSILPGPSLFLADDLRFPVVGESELLGQKLVAVAYRAHPRDLYDMLELDKRADRILPNGYCLLPPRQSCDRGNACLTCDKFATDRTHLDEHQRQLSGLLQIVDARREQFQRKTGREMPEDNVWLRERRKERRALESIIAALDAAAQTDQAVRGAGVQARLEEGRA